MEFDQRKEIDEAIEAVNYTLDHLIEAQKYLRRFIFCIINLSINSI